MSNAIETLFGFFAANLVLITGGDGAKTWHTLIHCRKYRGKVQASHIASGDGLPSACAAAGIPHFSQGDAKSGYHAAMKWYEMELAKALVNGDQSQATPQPVQQPTPQPVQQPTAPVAKEVISEALQPVQQSAAAPQVNRQKLVNAVRHFNISERTAEDAAGLRKALGNMGINVHGRVQKPASFVEYLQKSGVECREENGAIKIGLTGQDQAEMQAEQVQDSELQNVKAQLAGMQKMLAEFAGRLES